MKVSFPPYVGKLIYFKACFANVKQALNLYKPAVIIMIFISFIASQIPKTVDQIREIIKYNSYLGIVVCWVIPIILFIITKVKKYDKQRT